MNEQHSQKDPMERQKIPTLQESLEFLATTKIAYFSLNSQSEHRLNILQSWIKIAQENDYDLGSHIIGKQSLDVGCGQGDMIALFAAALKTQGNKESKVIGVDPASLDYGETA
jgi:2-polyprenyl-3-methyl-5-hydroxy-6-metoxy-1,4-benzoquinol methylase